MGMWRGEVDNVLMPCHSALVLWHISAGETKHAVNTPSKKKNNNVCPHAHTSEVLKTN